MKRVARLGLMLLSVMLMPLMFERQEPIAALTVEKDELKQESCLVLGGREHLDPLKIIAWPDGNIAVYRWRRTYPGSNQEAYMNCYFEDKAWGSMLDLWIGTDRYHWNTEYYQDVLYPEPTVSYLLPAGVHALSGDTLCTEWPLLDGELLLRQSLTYQAGDDLLVKRFDLINRGGRILSQIRLTHGGDIIFGEEASCSWNEASNTIVIDNLEQNVGGRAEFSCASQYPYAGWFAGSIYDAWDLLLTDSPLAGLGDELTDDAAILLQGKITRLDPGEQGSLVLYERYPDQPATEPTQPETAVTPAVEPTQPEFSETTGVPSFQDTETTAPTVAAPAPSSSADSVPATGAEAEAAMAEIGGALLLLAVVAAVWRGQLAAGIGLKRRRHE